MNGIGEPNRPVVAKARFVASKNSASLSTCRRGAVVSDGEGVELFVEAVTGMEIQKRAESGQHPLVGRRLPWHELETEAGENSPEFLRQARAVLIDLTGGDPGLFSMVTAWADRVDIVGAKLKTARSNGSFDRTAAVLVRPDGYVVWAAGEGVNPTEALLRWFGSPSRTAAIPERRSQKMER